MAVYKLAAESIHMALSDKCGIIADPGILTADHVPDHVPGREEHLKELRLCLDPIAEGKRPINVFLYGPPGGGKTFIALYVLNQLRATHRVYGVYVNCWERNTLYSVLDKIVTELRILGAEKPDASFKMERLQRHLKDTPLALVLDEIDRPAPKDRDAICYNLCQLGNVGLIFISNTRYSLFSLDDRIKSRLNVTQIELPPYSVSDLTYILSLRAEAALVPKTWDKPLLETIARMASGDARMAIQTLKNAAYYAEKKASPKILFEHVEMGWNDARTTKRSYLLKNLTADHRILYEIIRSKKETLSNDLWEAYLAEAQKRGTAPIALRTYSEYVNKLRDLGLIKIERARVRGKVRAFGVVE